MSVKTLRATTGMPVGMCNSAWKESGGNMEKALDLLRQKGMDKSVSLDSRDVQACYVGIYLHHDGKKAGVVKLECETDFVANTPEFRNLAKDIAMHICVTGSMEDLESQLFVVGELLTIGSMIKYLSGKTGEKITIGPVFRV